MAGAVWETFEENDKCLDTRAVRFEMEEILGSIDIAGVNIDELIRGLEEEGDERRGVRLVGEASVAADRRRSQEAVDKQFFSDKDLDATNWREADESIEQNASLTMMKVRDSTR